MGGHGFGGIIIVIWRIMTSGEAGVSGTTPHKLDKLEQVENRATEL